MVQKEVFCKRRETLFEKRVLSKQPFSKGSPPQKIPFEQILKMRNFWKVVDKGKFLGYYMDKQIKRI